MADNRKYYYLKLKEDFFDTDEMKILESMKDGYLYSNILLKLYLKSLSNSGRLMYRNVIPYTPEILATLTGHQVGTVEKALDVFKKLDLIDPFFCCLFKLPPALPLLLLFRYFLILPYIAITVRRIILNLVLGRMLHTKFIQCFFPYRFQVYT